MKTVLVFGGTFDPVHVGHVGSAMALLKLFNDACVYFVPCKVPPHRPEPAASPDQRIAMLRLAVAGVPGLEVDDCELRREGTSYTFDTLKAFRQQLSDSVSLIFVMGHDSWLTLPTWNRWRELCDVAHLMVLRRPKSEGSESTELASWSAQRRLEDAAELQQSSAGNICELMLTQFDVSATQIRKQLMQGGEIDPLLHFDVSRYIREQNLYLNTA
jgi:nicotinate-nucleotide adenylyltransferase